MDHDKILDMLMKDEEVTWQDIIHSLIKTDQMNPWNVDVSKLTQRYLEAVRKLQKTNFFVSGKVLLAAALLVKIKSNRLLAQDLSDFDNLLFHVDEPAEGLEDYVNPEERAKIDAPPLAIKTPQARKRVVSVNDLIGALEKALEVNKRKMLRREYWASRNPPPIPERKVNITDLIKGIFEKIMSLFSKKETVTFSKLLPQGEVGKREKILTLLPLLHLDNQEKIDLVQEIPFEEIYINIK
ncbi:MAG: segregation/condensation protein A [Candidatus Woesearchaeota archaeon]